MVIVSNQKALFFLLSALSCALHVYSESITNYSAAAEVSLRSKKYQAAEELIGRAIKSDPGKQGNYWIKYEIYKQQKMYSNALDVLHEIEHKFNVKNDTLKERVVECLFEMRLFEDVIREYDGGVPENTRRYWKGIYYLGMSYYEMEKYDESVRVFKILLNDAQGPKAKGKWNLLLGNAYRKSGRKALAKERYIATLDYIMDPWALLCLGVYALEDGDTALSYKYLNSFVQNCDIPNLLRLIRIDELDELYFEDDFLSLLAAIKDRCLTYFDVHNSKTANDIIRGNRAECLTTFCLFFLKSIEMQDGVSSIKIKGMMHQLGFKDVDIYMEAVRVSELNNNKTMENHYLQLLLEDNPHRVFTNTFLYTHCEWLKEVGKYDNDPRCGYYEEFIGLLDEYRKSHDAIQSASKGSSKGSVIEKVPVP